MHRVYHLCVDQPRGLSLFTNSRWFTTDEAAAES